MSNKTRLQTNNTNLQSLIDKANNLPDAGSGGGGGGATSGVFDILDLPVGSVIGSNCKLYFPYCDIDSQDIFYEISWTCQSNVLVAFSDGTAIYGNPDYDESSLALYLWWDDMEHPLWRDGVWNSAAMDADSVNTSYITLTEGVTVIANYIADYNLIKQNRIMVSNAIVDSNATISNTGLVSWAEGQLTHLTQRDLQGCTTIGMQAFQSQASIRSVALPDTVTTIEYAAFQGNYASKLIIIPESVFSIDSEAFNNADSLPIVVMLGSTPPTIEIDTFGNRAEDMAYVSRIYVPSGSGNTYKTATNWSTYADKIEEY